ncbi:hypothetical protein Tco_0957149 [Tanacetum coccineum]
MQAWDKFFEINHAQSEEVQELLYKLFEDLQSINEELAEYIKLPSWNLPTSSYDDDDDEESFIPLRDIIMSELPPFEASPPDSELVSLEEVKDFHREDREIEDDILREKLSKINLLIAKIEAINSNPPPSSDFVTKSSSTSLNFFLEETNTFDNSIPKSETFCFDLEENKSDFYHEEFASELAHIISPSEYDHFYFKIEPEMGNLTMDVVEDIIDIRRRAPRSLIPLDFDFIPSNDLGSDLDNSSPSGDRNKIYDPGICIKVESTRFLAPLSPVIDTLLPFSSENEDKVFNHGVLAYKEESPPSSSHRGLKAL